MFFQARRGLVINRGALDASSGGTPFSAVYVSNASNAAGSSPFTFTAQNIGTADATRIVVVGVANGPNGAAVTALTIAGISATKAAASDAGLATAERTSFWYAAVPTGTTGNIVVTCATESRVVISVFNVFGTTAAFSVAGAASSTTSVTTLSASAITVPSGGAAIAMGANHNASNTITPSNWTADFANLVAGSSVTSAGRDIVGSGSITYGISWTPTATDGSFSVIAFAP